MTITDQEVLEIINALLDHEGVLRGTRVQHLRAHRRSPALRVLGRLVARYLEIEDPPRTCQVTHARTWSSRSHWWSTCEGSMICGNQLPCARHGGG